MRTSRLRPRNHTRLACFPFPYLSRPWAVVWSVSPSQIDNQR